MSTEAKLWDAMYRLSLDFIGMTRFETELTLGVSDVEYVGTESHGWIELKVGYIPSFNEHTRSLRFGEDLKFEQQTWLLAHHRPHIGLRSFVLVGIPERHKNAWEMFLVLEPALAVGLAVHKIPWAKLQQHPGFHWFVQLHSALRFIAFINGKWRLKT